MVADKRCRSGILIPTARELIVFRVCAASAAGDCASYVLARNLTGTAERNTRYPKTTLRCGYLYLGAKLSGAVIHSRVTQILTSTMTMSLAMCEAFCVDFITVP